ncbi:MAG: MotA/TolQ/ExbB proton channel family protein [Opitutales bacterium]
MKQTIGQILKVSLLAAFLACFAQFAYAQDTDGAAVTAQTEEAAEAEAGGEAGEKNLWEMFQAGGWAMYPLLLLSIFGFGLIVYNFIAVQPKPILRPDLAEQIDERLSSLDIQGARQICEDNPAPMTNIVNAGLARVDVQEYNPEQVKEAVEEASSEELSGPYVLINYLSVIGSLSPMVGLLGTVSGMVKAFNVIEAQGAGNAQDLAGNISEALITTATGMIIGIPAMFFFFFFKNRYGKITSRIQRVVGDIQFDLARAIRAGGNDIAVEHRPRPVTRPAAADPATPGM